MVNLWEFLVWHGGLDVMTRARPCKLLLGTIVALCGAFALYQFAFWTLPQFEDARTRWRLSRIPGVQVLEHVDKCSVWLMRPVRQQQVEALGDGLSRLPDIEYFSTGRQCKLTRDGYAALSRAKSVQMLKVHGQDLEVDQMRSIARIPGLGILWLQDTAFPAGSFVALIDAEELESLVIQCSRATRCVMNEDDIGALARISSLREVRFSGTDVSPPLMDELRVKRKDIEVHWPRPAIEETLLRKMRFRERAP